MIDNRLIQAVLFDLDNTLIDRDTAFSDYCRELYRVHDAINGANSEEGAIALMESFDEGGLVSRDEFYARVLQKWPGAFSSIQEALDLHLPTYLRHVAIDDSVQALLEDIASAGLPIGIVTNGLTKTQTSKVVNCGLDKLVNTVAISESVGVYKPDPKIFQHALSGLNADPSSTIFVGDNPEADILGARTLGMRTAWIHRDRDWPYDDSRPDHVIGHVTEVRNILFG